MRFAHSFLLVFVASTTFAAPESFAAKAKANTKPTYHCIPVELHGETARVVALCDAAPLNKKFKVKTDPENRCVVGAQEKVEAVKGVMTRQASFISNSPKQAKALRPCEEREAVTYHTTTP